MQWKWVEIHPKRPDKQSLVTGPVSSRCIAWLKLPNVPNDLLFTARPRRLLLLIIQTLCTTLGMVMKTLSIGSYWMAWFTKTFMKTVNSTSHFLHAVKEEAEKSIALWDPPGFHQTHLSIRKVRHLTSLDSQIPKIYLILTISRFVFLSEDNIFYTAAAKSQDFNINALLLP